MGANENNPFIASVFLLKWNSNSSGKSEEGEEGKGDLWREKKRCNSCVRNWMCEWTMEMW